MRVAFTGGSGKAGKHAINYLINSGHKILNIDLKPLEIEGINNLIVDITDSGQIFNSLTSYLNIYESKSAEYKENLKTTGYCLPFDAFPVKGMHKLSS